MNEASHLHRVELERWWDAVRLQAGRAVTTSLETVLDPSRSPEEVHTIEADVFFLVIAAWLLYCSAGRVADDHPDAHDAIRQAQEVFVAEVGVDLKLARNIVSHFDEYVWGDGQVKLGELAPLIYVAREGYVRVALAPGVDPEVGAIEVACRKLYETAVRASI